MSLRGALFATKQSLNNEGIASLRLQRHGYNMIHTWKISKTKMNEIHFTDESSLDAITRQLPDGYYSTFRTYDVCTRVIGLFAHLRRLPNVDASVLRRSLLQLLEPFRPGETRVRVMFTFDGQIYISIEPLKLLPREVYEKGVRVETTTIQRAAPRLKSTTFISESDDERKHLAQEGIFEALLVKNGKILEGMTSNFFYILNPALENAGYANENMRSRRSLTPSVLYTARNDILLGVTRTMVIRAARGRGVEVRYSPLKLNQLPAVKEAFITSSSRGVVPVIQIDGVMIGQGSPGKITRMLMRAYEEYVLKHAEKI